MLQAECMQPNDLTPRDLSWALGKICGCRLPQSCQTKKLRKPHTNMQAQPAAIFMLGETVTALEAVAWLQARHTAETAAGLCTAVKLASQAVQGCVCHAI